MKHLANVSGLDMAKMSVDVASVAFRGSEADVTVTITPQGMDAASGMQMVYTMEQKGGAWAVKGRRGSTPGNPHGMMPGGSALPPGHPPAEAPRQ